MCVYIFMYICQYSLLLGRGCHQFGAGNSCFHLTEPTEERNWSRSVGCVDKQRNDAHTVCGPTFHWRTGTSRSQQRQGQTGCRHIPATRRQMDIIPCLVILCIYLFCFVFVVFFAYFENSRQKKNKTQTNQPTKKSSPLHQIRMSDSKRHC